MTEIGSPRFLYSLATARSSSWVSVAKLALPEAHGELGHHGHRAGDRRVSFLDGRGGVSAVIQ